MMETKRMRQHEMEQYILDHRDTFDDCVYIYMYVHFK